MKPSQEKTIERVNRQLKEMAYIYRDAVSKTGTSENEFWIWYTLIAIEGNHSQQDICKMWSLSKQTVNSIISHFVKNDFVSLEVVPHTRNRKIVKLTDSGRSYGENLVLPITLAEQLAFDAMPVDQQHAFTSALDTYIQLLKQEIGKISKTNSETGEAT